MTEQEQKDLEAKVAGKTALLQQIILVTGMNMSSSTVAALRLTARLIEMGRGPKPTGDEVKAELSFAVVDSQRHKS